MILLLYILTTLWVKRKKNNLEQLQKIVQLTKTFLSISRQLVIFGTSNRGWWSIFTNTVLWHSEGFCYCFSLTIRQLVTFHSFWATRHEHWFKTLRNKNSHEWYLQSDFSVVLKWLKFLVFIFQWYVGFKKKWHKLQQMSKAQFTEITITIISAKMNSNFTLFGYLLVSSW